MKNALNIAASGETLLSTVDDGTNRLYINGTIVPSTDWTGTGTYTATVQGHQITIAKVEEDSGNIALRKTADYTYELYKIKTGTTIDGDLIVTGSISEGGVKLEDKYGGKMTLLWSNPNPTSGITSTTVTLSQNVNNFDVCIVRFKYSTSNIPYGSQLVFPNAQTVLAMMSGTQQYILGRPITLSGTTATIGVAHQYENKSTPSQQNNYVIPIEIYGIKL